MNLLQPMLTICRRATERLAWLGPLLARVVLGLEFVGTGWGKLHNHAQVTDYFHELGLPLAARNSQRLPELQTPR